MPTNKNYIPIDSSYEKQVCDALIEQNRRFVKPLRYDAGNEVLEDFFLIDTDEQVPMEIYGMTGNEEYDERKKAKIAIYERSGLPFWHWDVKLSPKMWPTFPDKTH